mgnify:CR=1 FL=1
MPKRRNEVGDITDGKIFHLVVGRDFFSDGFGRLDKAKPADRDRMRQRMMRRMRAAWQHKAVRDRAWQMARERGRDAPWAAKFGDPEGRLSGGGEEEPGNSPQRDTPA